MVTNVVHVHCFKSLANDYEISSMSIKHTVKLLLSVVVLVTVLVLFELNVFQPGGFHHSDFSQPYSAKMTIRNDNCIQDGRRAGPIEKKHSIKNQIEGIETSSRLLNSTQEELKNTSNTRPLSSDHKALYPGRNLEKNSLFLQLENSNSNSNTSVCEYRTQFFEGKSRKPLLRITKQNVHCFRETLDLINQAPLQFLSNFKNPCWHGNQNNGLFKDKDLHCLPYFFILGVKKSGTTDLHGNIRAHPEYCFPGFKESQWFGRLRYGISAGPPVQNGINNAFKRGQDNMKVQFYSAMYDKAADCISNIAGNQSAPYRSKITGDAAPSTFHMHTNWEILPGNEGLTEPRYTNFHYIKHLVPNAKIIIIMRDPVTRLYSDFFHMKRLHRIRSSNAALTFHQHVATLTNAYNECFKQHSVRECVYNNTLRAHLIKTCCWLAESFVAGFYAVFLEDVIDVFGRDKILTLAMPDYVHNMRSTMETVFEFLELKPLSSEEMESKITKRSGSSKKRYTAEMLSHTRKKLYDFYKPWNVRLARLLTDDKYLFQSR